MPEVGIGHSRLIFCFWFDKLTIAKYLTPLTSTRPGRFADSVGARFDSHSNTKILKPKCIHIWVKVFYVPEVGIEPTSLARHDFKSCAYTYSATRANEKYTSYFSKFNLPSCRPPPFSRIKHKGFMFYPLGLMKNIYLSKITFKQYNNCIISQKRQILLYFSYV